VAVIGRYRAVQRPQFAVGAIDLLARALATQGPFAPPASAVDCVILGQTAPTARTFDPPLKLVARQTANGFLVLDGRYRIGEGPVRDVPLAEGTYAAQLRGAAFQPSSFDLVWPPGTPRSPTKPKSLVDPTKVPIDIELLPAAGYPFPDLTATPFNLGPTLIRGSVFTAAGDPVADAAVSVNVQLPLTPPNLPWPFSATLTGASGDWALLLPDRRRIGSANETPVPALTPAPMTIRIAYPKSGPVVNIPKLITLGRENFVPNTALRGQVAGPGGRALAGATITTTVNALASRSRTDGSWSLYFDPNQADAANVTVTATGPAGTSATALAAVKHGATVVVPTIHLG
jgi:hypothetical protein